MTQLSSAKRSLVVGASGQVGFQLMSALGAHALPTARQPTSAGWLPLDLAEIQSPSQLEALLPGLELEAIYCSGGMTNVELCEHQTDLAMRTNCVGPAVFARYARDRELPFVYFSTEYVFDGENGPYDEQALANPLSVYGRSKFAGEQAVQAAHPHALIVRTTVVYGPDPTGKNFLHALRRNLTAGTAFRVPNDQISTPTYNRDLAFATVSLVRRGASGVFHICGPERMSRFEFSLRAAALWGLDPSALNGVSTAELGQVAPRPLKAGLLIGKLIRLHPGLEPRTLETALHDWAISN